MKKLIIFIFLSFSGTMLNAQNLSFGLSYNTIKHEGYNQIFDNNALGYNLYYSSEDSRGYWETLFQGYYEQYTLENTRVNILEDTLYTDTDLYSFGGNLIFERIIGGYDDNIIPFIGFGGGLGYYYASQSRERPGFNISDDVGGVVLRGFPSAGVRYMFTENFGAEVFCNVYLNYYIAVSNDNRTETNDFFIHPVVSLNLIYQFL